MIIPNLVQNPLHDRIIIPQMQRRFPMKRSQDPLTRLEEPNIPPNSNSSIVPMTLNQRNTPKSLTQLLIPPSPDFRIALVLNMVAPNREERKSDITSRRRP